MRPILSRWLCSYRLLNNDEKYDEGDEIDVWSQVVLQDGLSSEIDLSSALVHRWENNGFSLFFDTNSEEILVQRFKKSNASFNNAEAYAASGDPKPYEFYDRKVLDEERNHNIDLNNDGFIGEKDVEIKKVLLSDEDSDQYFYLTQDNDIIMAQEELDEGDIVSDWFRKIIDKSGDTFDFKGGIKAFSWINNGFGIIYKDNPEYKLQSFTESNDVASPRGNPQSNQ